MVTGGEPTLQKDLPVFLRKIKNLGFLVKLDTNGTNPEIVDSLIKDKLVDYVAIDYKGPFEKYDKYIGQVTGNRLQVTVKKTIEILAKSKIAFELRTTVVPTLHTEKDLIEMAKEISNFRWYLQNFRPTNCLDPEFEKIKPYDQEFFHNILIKLQYYVKGVSVR